MNDEHKIFKLNRGIFWDVAPENIPDLIKNVPEISIPRIFHGGTKEEIDNMIDYYGYDKVRETLKEQLSKRNIVVIEQACKMFNLKVRDFQCYTNKQFLSLY